MKRKPVRGGWRSDPQEVRARRGRPYDRARRRAAALAVLERKRNPVPLRRTHCVGIYGLDVTTWKTFRDQLIDDNLSLSPWMIGAILRYLQERKP